MLNSSSMKLLTETLTALLIDLAEKAVAALLAILLEAIRRNSEPKLPGM